MAGTAIPCLHVSIQPLREAFMCHSFEMFIIVLLLLLLFPV